MRGDSVGRPAPPGPGRARQAAAAVSVALAVLAAGLSVGPARAELPEAVEDLLWELQLVPLSGEAPPFTLPGLDGTPRSLASLKGHVVLLYFWATW